MHAIEEKSINIHSLTTDCLELFNFHVVSRLHEVELCRKEYKASRLLSKLPTSQVTCIQRNLLLCFTHVQHVEKMKKQNILLTN